MDAQSQVVSCSPTPRQVIYSFSLSYPIPSPPLPSAPLPSPPRVVCMVSTLRSWLIYCLRISSKLMRQLYIRFG